ncbi:MAG TPA: hypothetical protein VFZ89_14460 [Solirubrobacteraceae bacterium]
MPGSRIACLSSCGVLLLVAGCGGDDGGGGGPSALRAPAATTAATAPGLCGPLRPQALGRVRGGNVSELSGLTRTSDGRLFAIEDSGNSATVIAMRRDGRVLRRIPVPGAQNVDWEDLAARGRELFVADIGDNATTRPSIEIYRPGRSTLVLRYPDTPHDAEALLVDPLRDQLLVVTKGLLDARVYSGHLRSGTLRRGARLAFGLVTAGAVSSDGRTVALRSYDTLAVWRRRGREPLTRTLTREPCVSPTSLARESQGEALALDGDAVLTAPEGRDPVLTRWSPR